MAKSKRPKSSIDPINNTITQNANNPNTPIVTEHIITPHSYLTVDEVSNQKPEEMNNEYLSKNYPSYNARKEFKKRSYKRRKLTKEQWLTVAKKYIHGVTVRNPKTNKEDHYWPTLKDLAHQYGISYDYIKEKSCRNKWGAMKKIVKSKMAEKREDEELNQLLCTAADLDLKKLTAVNKLDKIIDNRLSYLTDDTESEDIKATEIKAIVESLIKLHNLSRDLLREDETIKEIKEELKRSRQRQESKNTPITEEEIAQIQKLLSMDDT